MTNSKKKAKVRTLKKELWRHRELYLFLIPGLIALLIFYYMPMYGVLMSFQDVKIGAGFAQNDWVGFYHFKRFFRSAWFTTVIKNTVSISFILVGLTWPFPLVLALLLHNTKRIRLKKITQTASYLPYLLSTVIVVSIINVFCAGDYGLINIVLRNSGMDKINFFGSPDWVYPLYVISHVWQATGYAAVIYIGALSSVDNSLMEAAKIDGASLLKCIWHIQIPTILPTICTMLILSIGNMFSLGADKMILMQTPLNLESSEIISTYVYKAGFADLQYGFSTAVGLFQNIINLIMLVTVNKISKKLSGTAIV